MAKALVRRLRFPLWCGKRREHVCDCTIGVKNRCLFLCFSIGLSSTHTRLDTKPCLLAWREMRLPSCLSSFEISHWTSLGCSLSDPARSLSARHTCLYQHAHKIGWHAIGHSRSRLLYRSACFRQVQQMYCTGGADRTCTLPRSIKGQLFCHQARKAHGTKLPRPRCFAKLDEAQYLY